MSQTFTVTLELGNDAMRTAGAVVASLRKIANQIQEERYPEDPLYPTDSRSVRDRNGNTVGSWNVDEMPDRDHPGLEARRKRARRTS